MENNINRCPKCDSKRLKKLTLNNEYYCPKCSKKFSITVKEIEINSCFKCNKPVIDLCKSLMMANGKIKHNKCRKNLEGMKNA
jgi:ribosomal protein L37AE/L43A